MNGREKNDKNQWQRKNSTGCQSKFNFTEIISVEQRNLVHVSICSDSLSYEKEHNIHNEAEILPQWYDSWNIRLKMLGILVYVSAIFVNIEKKFHFTQFILQCLIMLIFMILTLQELLRHCDWQRGFRFITLPTSIHTQSNINSTSAILFTFPYGFPNFLLYKSVRPLRDFKYWVIKCCLAEENHWLRAVLWEIWMPCYDILILKMRDI